MFKTIPNEWEISGSILMFITAFIPVIEDICKVYAQKKSSVDRVYDTEDLQFDESDAAALL